MRGLCILAAGLAQHLFQSAASLCVYVYVRVCVCTLVPEYPRRTSSHSVSLKCHLPLLLSNRPFCRLALCILKNSLPFSPLPVVSVISSECSAPPCRACSFKFANPPGQVQTKNWTGGRQQASFGHFQFRRADNFWICQTAFHSSAQYLNRLGHFLFLFVPKPQFFLFPARDFAYPMQCHWIHCSFFLAAFYRGRDEKVLQNYRLSPGLMYGVCRHVFRSECWVTFYFIFLKNVWAPTQPERSVCVQLRCCQRRWPRYRRLIADL